jgi:TetR/AcrR family transcriptional regulator
VSEAELRRPGRPRATPAGRPNARGGSDPRREILAVVGELFGEGGYPAVTMSGVARGVGLRQQSLYYYFPSKEALFAAFVASSYTAPLELLHRITQRGGSPPAQLFRFVYGDIRELCQLPFAVADIHRVATRDRRLFASYWSDRDVLERALARVLRAGTRSGDLRPTPARRWAQLVLLWDDAAQSWYRLNPKARAAVLATEVADTVLRGLLTRPQRIDDVRREADCR